MATVGSIRRLTLLALRHHDVLRPTMGLRQGDLPEKPPQRIAEAFALIGGKHLRPHQWPQQEMGELGIKALEAARTYLPDLVPLVEEVNSAYEDLFRPSKNVIERATHVCHGLPKFFNRTCNLRRAWPASTSEEIDAIHAAATEIDRLAGEFRPRSSAIERELPLTLASFVSMPGGEPAVKDHNESLGRQQWNLEQAFFGAAGEQLLAAVEAGAFADSPQLIDLVIDYLPPQPRVLEQNDPWEYTYRKLFHEAIRQWLPNVQPGYGGFEYPDCSLDVHLPTDVRTAKSVEENIRAMARAVEAEYHRLGGRPPIMAISGTDATAPEVSLSIEPQTPPQPQAPDPDGKKEPAEILKSLQPALRRAYLSYQLAETMEGNRLIDSAAYELLKEFDFSTETQNLEDLGEYALPDYETWTRQLRFARKALGEQKYTPRAGNRPGARRGRQGAPILDESQKRVSGSIARASDR